MSGTLTSIFSVGRHAFAAKLTRIRSARFHIIGAVHQLVFVMQIGNNAHRSVQSQSTEFIFRVLTNVKRVQKRSYVHR